MRVLVGTFEIAGLLSVLADGFRSLGHRVTTVVRDRHRYYPEIQYDVNLIGGASGEQIVELIASHDLFCFQFSGSLLDDNLDFPMIKSQGKRIISLFNGDDIRHTSAHLQEYGIDLRQLGHQVNDPLQRPLRNLRMAEWFSDLVVHTPTNAGLSLRPYLDFFVPLNLARYQFNIPEREVPLIVHAPSSQAIKGTERILNALENLRLKGVPFELRLLTEVTNEAVLNALSEADVAIDQLYIPYGGMFTLEGMACGCAVATAAPEDIQAFARHRPLWKIDANNLEMQLETLLTNKALRLKLAEEGRRYVETYHDHVHVALRMLDALMGIEAGDFVPDYYPTFFARHYRLPPQEVIPPYLKRLTAVIVQRYGLPVDVAVEQLIARGLMSPHGLDASQPIPRWPESLPSIFDKEEAAAGQAEYPRLPVMTSFNFSSDPAFDRYERALATCPEELLSADDTAIIEWLRMGEEYLRFGFSNAALSAYRRAVETNPNSAAARFSLANLCLGQGRLQEAIDLYQQAAALASDFAPAFYYLAITLTLQNRTNDALPIMQKAIASLPRTPNELIWGPLPMACYRHWSAAMRQDGRRSKTLVQDYDHESDQREDYDLYFEDLLPLWVHGDMRDRLLPYFAFLYTLLNASVVHLPLNGGFLSHTPFAPVEAELYQSAGIKIVVFSHGVASLPPSYLRDSSLKHALLLTNPYAGRYDADIAEQVAYWSRHADIVIVDSLAAHGVGRYDILTPQPCCLDSRQWKAKATFSEADGVNGVVKVLHISDGQDDLRGSAFIPLAVEELKKEGLQVELVLAQKASHEQVKALMQEADIFVEQLIACGYAFRAIEGMASALPVLSNLDDDHLARLYRRYAYLNECPILSTTPETIKHHLWLLIKNPRLRRQLGLAGRQYVEKYHSYRTAQYMFSAVYDKLLDGKDKDLMNLFNPLKSEYNNLISWVNHPLVNNRLVTPPG